MVGNAVDSLLREIGQEVWEIRITGSTDGDTPLDYPVKTTKRHRVYGSFRIATKEVFELVGISEDADAVFYTRERINMTSQLEYEDEYYEIREEVPVKPLHAGDSYAYILTKLGNSRRRAV